MDKEESPSKPTVIKTPWLGSKLGYLTDWVTQRWVQFTGRSIDVNKDSWLDGPFGNAERIGKDCFTELANVAELLVDNAGWTVCSVHADPGYMLAMVR